MGSSKPQPVKAPFEQQQQQQGSFSRSYTPYSIAETPLGQEFKNAKLDYGDETNVDPGVARRTALAEQEEENRSDSAFNFGVPRFIRDANRSKNLRDIRSEGAYQSQAAEYANQQGNNQRRGMATQANVARLERLLPQLLETSGTSTGTGASSGYNTQIVQPQPGFLQRLAVAGVGGASSALRFGSGGG